MIIQTLLSKFHTELVPTDLFEAHCGPTSHDSESSHGNYRQNFRLWLIVSWETEILQND